MTCIHEDIKAALDDEIKKGRIPGLNFDMIFYADDTILYSTEIKAIESLLEKVERISKKSGLALNKDKCVNLNMNTKEEQVFSDGKKIKRLRTGENFKCFLLGTMNKFQLFFTNSMISLISVISVIFPNFFDCSEFSTLFNLLPDYLDF